MPICLPDSNKKKRKWKWKEKCWKKWMESEHASLYLSLSKGAKYGLSEEVTASFLRICTHVFMHYELHHCIDLIKYSQSHNNTWTETKCKTYWCIDLWPQGFNTDSAGSTLTLQPMWGYNTTIHNLTEITSWLSVFAMYLPSPTTVSSQTAQVIDA